MENADEAPIRHLLHGLSVCVRHIISRLLLVQGEHRLSISASWKAIVYMPHTLYCAGDHACQKPVNPDDLWDSKRFTDETINGTNAKPLELNFSFYDSRVFLTIFLLLHIIVWENLCLLLNILSYIWINWYFAPMVSHSAKMNLIPRGWETKK